MNHKTEAVRLDRLSSVQPDADSANSFALSGLLHATLAVAEQLRISNLIAIACGTSEGQMSRVARDLAYLALVESGPDGNLHPHIAAALGIGDGK